MEEDGPDEDSVPIEIIPAAVLRRVRDGGPISTVTLARSFGVIVGISQMNHARAALELAACLKRLAEAGMIRRVGRAKADDEPVPFLGVNFSWVATPRLHKVQRALHLSLSETAKSQQRAHLAEARRLRSLRTRLEPALLHTCFRADLLASFEELTSSLERRCYIAVMALSGKILEICIKHELESQGQPVDDSWMLGALLGRLKVSGVAYVDPALNNIANIINVSRIPAVHAKLNIPVPSEDQAVMVVRAVCDVLERTLLAPTRQGADAP